LQVIRATFRAKKQQDNCADGPKEKLCSATCATTSKKKTKKKKKKNKKRPKSTQNTKNNTQRKCNVLH